MKCYLCNMTYGKDDDHCCICKETYVDKKHCHACNVEYSIQTPNHCCQCKQSYRSKVHCCQCKMNIDEYEKHCCNCKCSYIISKPPYSVGLYYIQNHCCQCNETYNETKYIYQEDYYNYVWEKFPNMKHCQNCHISYRSGVQHSC